MSRRALEEVLARAMEDGTFREWLLAAPSEALDGYDLSAEELQALIAGDLRSVLLAMGRDEQEDNVP
ncbi:MAG: Os1348 family NHLP clan protein [Armatimonadota bacterium]|nr:Os1348 family NHLP clan protein [Armatimonadota bacterium]